MSIADAKAIIDSIEAEQAKKMTSRALRETLLAICSAANISPYAVPFLKDLQEAEDKISPLRAYIANNSN